MVVLKFDLVFAQLNEATNCWRQFTGAGFQKEKNASYNSGCVER
jgi:hypothetical protein